MPARASRRARTAAAPHAAHAQPPIDSRSAHGC
jgi:hypothetical protein